MGFPINLYLVSRSVFLNVSLESGKRRKSFSLNRQSPPALRHSNSEEVEETLRNDAAHSSAAASNYTNCEEMRDIEEVSTEEVQHSRFHAKPFDIHFLLESYPVV
ncbi:uncharacterized protein LOC112590604 [Harpegnathos saltator]|uniref:uncharacterized protein LOC112590604 n=1 Tax=Harpegnathos saltator TaxID=610380 RepID=UPI000DBEE51E|nr:uncharacterized protein LOC112590604 [Harpegnathos saltator]